MDFGEMTLSERHGAMAQELATLRAQLAEARAREAVKGAAIAKALAIHDRYCDRVGVADSSWVDAVHAALRDASALAIAATRGREG